MQSSLKPVRSLTPDLISTVRHMVKHSPEIKLALEAELAMPAEEATEADLHKLLSPSAIEGIKQYAELLQFRQTVEAKRNKRHWKHGGRP